MSRSDALDAEWLAEVVATLDADWLAEVVATLPAADWWAEVLDS